MGAERRKKDLIRDIKNHLIGLGAEFLHKSEASNSVYLKLDNTKIRVSDHIPPLIKGRIDVVVEYTGHRGIISVDGIIIMFDRPRDIKSFLSNWHQINECKSLSTISIQNCEINKRKLKLQEASYKLQKTNEAFNKITGDIIKSKQVLKNIQNQINQAVNDLKIAQLPEMFEDVDFNKLSQRQLNAIKNIIQPQK